MPAFSNNMEAFSIYDDPGSEMIEDYNLIGWTQDVDGDGEITFVGDGLENLGKYYMGLSSMVQLVMGDQNQLYVFFTSLTETYDNGSQNYRHLWSRVSTDGGLSWGPFTDLSDDLIHIFDEFAFPSCAENTEPNSIYLICQIDSEPGMAVAGDEDLYGDNNMVVMEVFKDEITGIADKLAEPVFLRCFRIIPTR
ncbi:MAG: sialidase family protein [Bacteroidales bacterium]